MPRPGLVIFDCDGVLVDTETLANRRLSAWLTEAGFAISYEDCRRTFCGRSMKSVQEEVAQAVNPEARVVYVDNDPIVLAHGRALLARDNRTRVVTADLMDADHVLNHPEIDGFLDFSRPLGLLMVAVIHHILDEEDPAATVNYYKDRLAPGSHLFVTHFCNAFPEARAMEQNLIASLGRGQLRSKEQIEGFLDGLEIVEPGVVPLPLWRPDGPVSEPLDHSGLLIFAGMGRKAAGSQA